MLTKLKRFTVSLREIVRPLYSICLGFTASSGLYNMRLVCGAKPVKFQTSLIFPATYGDTYFLQFKHKNLHNLFMTAGIRAPVTQIKIRRRLTEPEWIDGSSICLNDSATIKSMNLFIHRLQLCFFWLICIDHMLLF